MSSLHRLVARIAAWFKRAEFDQDLDAELETHLSLLVEEGMRARIVTRRSAPGGSAKPGKCFEFARGASRNQRFTFR